MAKSKEIMPEKASKIKEEVAEEKEIKIEDVFRYGIDELKEKINKNTEIDVEERESLLDTFLMQYDNIEEFLDKNPERMKEVLENMKHWNPRVEMKGVAEQTKISDFDFCKSFLGYKFLNSIARFEEINPSEKMRKILDRIISKNGQATYFELKRLNEMDLSDAEVNLIEKMIDLESEPRLTSLDSSWREFIFTRRGEDISSAGREAKEQEQTLLDEEKFNFIKNNVETVDKELRDKGIFIDDFDWKIALKIGEKGITEKMLFEASRIQDICRRYGITSQMIDAEYLFDFIKSSEEEKQKIFSSQLKEKIQGFKIKPELFSDILDAYEMFDGEGWKKQFLFKSEKQIKKVLSDFDIGEINVSDFRYRLLSFLKIREQDGYLDGISPKDYFNEKLTNEGKEFSKFLVENSSIRKEISHKFIEDIRKTKGDYQAKTFPVDLLKYISSSLASSYLTFKNPENDILEELKKKSKESEVHKKIYNKTHSNVLEVNDVALGRKTTKKILEKGNFEYLLVAEKLDIPFDFYGVAGKDLDEVKTKIDNMASELVKGYEQNKDKYLPHIDSLLGYAAENKKRVNETLEIKDLWDFKFSHTGELNSILKEVKNLKINFNEGTQKQEDVRFYIKKLEEFLKYENLSQAEEKISLIKEKNRDKAIGLIEGMRNISDTLKMGKVPEKKDIDTLLSNKAILGHLGLGFSLENLRQVYQKIIKTQKQEKVSGTVEALKSSEEYFGAIDIEPSCMGAGGIFENFAMVVTQAPILILGVKNNSGKIIGRSLLIPIKERRYEGDEEGKYRFELKDTYGMGKAHIKDFVKKMEQELRNKTKDYYKGVGEIITKDTVEGDLAKSKKTPSMGKLEFYRDDGGACVFEEVE
jgi:hypothetical protein